MQLGQGDFDKDYISAKDQYCASWDAFDSESGVLKSEIAVCSAINSDDCVQQFLDVGNKTFVCIANLQFKDGVQYMTTIRSTNKVSMRIRGVASMFGQGFNDKEKVRVVWKNWKLSVFTGF